MASTYTVTIDVSDFAIDAPTSRLAFVTFARGSVSSAGTAIVTTAPRGVRLVNGHGTIVLEQAAVYRIRFYGIAGLEAPFWAAATSDCTAAQLRQSFQVDPTTMLAAPVPVTVAELIEAVRTGPAGGFLGARFPNPGVNETALDSAVAGRLRAAGSGTAVAVHDLLTGAATDRGDGTATIS